MMERWSGIASLMMGMRLQSRSRWLCSDCAPCSTATTQFELLDRASNLIAGLRAKKLLESKMNVTLAGKSKEFGVCQLCTGVLFGQVIGRLVNHHHHQLSLVHLHQHIAQPAPAPNSTTGSGCRVSVLSLKMPTIWQQPAPSTFIVHQLELAFFDAFTL